MSSDRVRDGLAILFEGVMSRFATAKREWVHARGSGDLSLQQMWAQVLRKALNDADTALLVLCQRRGSKDRYTQSAQALLTVEREHIQPMLDEFFAYEISACSVKQED
jgi:hypothetical protein